MNIGNYMPDKEYYETLSFEYYHCANLRRGIDLAIRLRKLCRLICETYDAKPYRGLDGKLVSGMTQHEIIEHVAWMKRWEYWHRQVVQIQAILGHTRKS